MDVNYEGFKISGRKEQMLQAVRAINASPEKTNEILEKLVGTRFVTLDEVPPGVDKYGRTLARVLTAEGRDAGAALILDGLAEVYTRGHRPLIQQYYLLEREALLERRGIWADVPVLSPERLGGSEGDLILVEGRIAAVRTAGGHRFLDFHAGGREAYLQGFQHVLFGSAVV